MELIHYLLILVVLVLAIGGFIFLRSRTDSDTVSVPEAERKTSRRSGLGAALRSAWGVGLDESTWDSFEEALLAADVGVAATTGIIDPVRSDKPESYEAALGAIATQMKAQFTQSDRELDLAGSPAIILVVGVNGSGKTTTIAKLAHFLGESGRSVLLGAADTFRAAAADQLVTWGDRLGVRVVRGGEGGDPASVAHDAMSAAESAGSDVVIIDTAGRLHGKKNLMDELGKIHRVATGGGSRPAEVLLVLDATSGQNGLTQVLEFGQTVPLTGVVLTKLDGTAKGGIVVAVEKDLGVPVKFVGVGESQSDLLPFDPNTFVDDLLEA